MPLREILAGHATLMVHRTGGTVFEQVELEVLEPQPMVAITIGRKTTKTFITSASQPWQVRVRASEERTEHIDVRADELVIGQRLLTVRPRSRLGKVVPSPFGVAAGIVFGDGYRPKGRDAAAVTLHGPKRQLVHFFRGCQSSVNADGSINVWGLPGSFKDKIRLTEGSSTLYGWLAGYVATDGSVSGVGQVSLSSSRWDHLDYARTVATRLGIGTGDITTYSRVGLGHPEPTELHSVRLQSPPLELLLRDEHRLNWRPAINPAPSWTVRSVEPRPDAELWRLGTQDGGSIVLDGYVVVPAHQSLRAASQA